MGIVRAAYALPRLRALAKESAAAWGAAAPKGIERRAVAAWDEDAVTLAAEAARALTDIPPLSAIYVATPEGKGAATLAEALGQPAARAVDLAGGPHAGLAALAAALDHAAAGGAALAVASDAGRAPPGSAAEHVAGAAAAAFLALPRQGAVLAGASAASAESLDDLPPAESATRLLLRAFKSFAGWKAPAAASATPAGRYESADGKPFETTEPLRADAGDLGVASVANLAALFAKAAPGSRIVAGVASPGAALALAFDVETAVSVASSVPSPREIGYVRSLQERHALAPATIGEPMGAFVSPAAWLAEIDARYRLAARRCAKGHLHYPPRPACPECGEARMRPETLSGRAEVETFTVIGRGGAPGEFAAEQAAVGEYPVAVVRFEEGPRCTVRLADVERDALRIGLSVRPALRRLFEQQGVVRYGLKFVPA